MLKAVCTNRDVELQYSLDHVMGRVPWICLFYSVLSLLRWIDGISSWFETEPNQNSYWCTHGIKLIQVLDDSAFIPIREIIRQTDSVCLTQRLRCILIRSSSQIWKCSQFLQLPLVDCLGGLLEENKYKHCLSSIVGSVHPRHGSLEGTLPIEVLQAALWDSRWRRVNSRTRMPSRDIRGQFAFQIDIAAIDIVANLLILSLLYLVHSPFRFVLSYIHIIRGAQLTNLLRTRCHRTKVIASPAQKPVPEILGVFCLLTCIESIEWNSGGGSIYHDGRRIGVERPPNERKLFIWGYSMDGLKRALWLPYKTILITSFVIEPSFQPRYKP